MLYAKYILFPKLDSTQGHENDVQKLKKELKRLENKFSEDGDLKEEANVIRLQNQELRAKVIRQDAAWKRKIASERRRGALGDCTAVVANARADAARRCDQNEVGWASAKAARLPVRSGADVGSDSRIPLCVQRPRTSSTANARTTEEIESPA